MTLFRSLIPALLFAFLISCGTTHPPAISEAEQVYNPWNGAEIPSGYNPADYDTISIVTWNIEHFVDDYDSPYIDHPRENNPADNLPKRRQLLADAIAELDADIVVFQEVESASYIQAWAEEHIEEMGYQLFTGRESNDWYMNVIIMSRLPLGMLYSYANISTPILGQTDDNGNPSQQYFTNNRMVSVDVLVNPEYTFTLTGVHLKAGRGDRNEGWRKGQINLLRAHYGRLLSETPGAKILLTGDLNTQPGDPEYTRVLGEDTDVVFVDPMAGRETLTHPTDRPTRQLDYIIPNIYMLESKVPGSAVIPVPFDEETMRLISDHRPVMIRFVTTGEK